MDCFFDNDYQYALHNIPAPGGNGCHGALLGVATRGILCGKDDETIFDDIRRHIPAGRRVVEDLEIEQAIQRAHLDTKPWWQKNETERPVFVPRSFLDAETSSFINWLEQGGKSELQRNLLCMGEKEMPQTWQDMQKPNHNEVIFADTIRLLRAQFVPEDLVYIGPQNGGMNFIKPAKDWIEILENIQRGFGNLPKDEWSFNIDYHSDLYTFILPNPLTGEESLCKDQTTTTYRGDNCVKEFRTMILEFDRLSIPNQYATLRGLRQLGVDIQAVVFSGNKSCHAWLSCPGVTSLEDWQKTVKGELFPIFGAIEADTACSNPSRLTRLPGVRRVGKQCWQKLLFLKKDGKEL